MATVEVKVPDIGDFKDVEIIEVLVKPGDRIKAEQSLVTVESDKASMEIPSSAAGVVKEMRVKLGDKISEGSPLLVLESEGGAEPRRACTGRSTSRCRGEPAPRRRAAAALAVARRWRGPAAAGPIEIVVPDIGDFDEVSVIEVLVKPGDSVAAEQSLITVESDKASMEIPSSHAGVVQALKVKVGDKVSKGSAIATLQGAGGAAPAAAAAPRPRRPAAPAPAAAPAAAAPPAGGEDAADGGAAGARADRAAGRLAACLADDPQARPRARRAAGRGEGQRAEGPHHPGRRPGLRQGGDGRHAATQAQAAKAPSAGAAAGGGAFPGLPAWPQVDFAKFGPIEKKELSRIKKISGPVLHRNWVVIPHVTNHDDADITELEAFRVATNKENEKSGVKVTMLAFLIKAWSPRCRSFPTSTPASRATTWC